MAAPSLRGDEAPERLEIDDVDERDETAETDNNHK